MKQSYPHISRTGSTVTIEARTMAEADAAAEVALGPGFTVTSVRRLRRGGVGGFFAQELVEMVASIGAPQAVAPDMASAEDLLRSLQRNDGDFATRLLDRMGDLDDDVTIAQLYSTARAAGVSDETAWNELIEPALRAAPGHDHQAWDGVPDADDFHDEGTRTDEIPTVAAPVAPSADHLPPEVQLDAPVLPSRGAARAAARDAGTDAPREVAGPHRPAPPVDPVATALAPRVLPPGSTGPLAEMPPRPMRFEDETGQWTEADEADAAAALAGAGSAGGDAIVPPTVPAPPPPSSSPALALTSPALALAAPVLPPPSAARPLPPPPASVPAAPVPDTAAEHPAAAAETGTVTTAVVGPEPLAGSSWTGDTRTGETRTGETRTGDTRTGDTWGSEPVPGGSGSDPAAYAEIGFDAELGEPWDTFGTARVDEPEPAAADPIMHEWLRILQTPEPLVGETALGPAMPADLPSAASLAEAIDALDALPDLNGPVVPVVPVETDPPARRIGPGTVVQAAPARVDASAAGEPDPDPAMRPSIVDRTPVPTTSSEVTVDDDAGVDLFAGLPDDVIPAPERAADHDDDADDDLPPRPVGFRPAGLESLRPLRRTTAWRARPVPRDPALPTAATADPAIVTPVAEGASAAPADPDVAPMADPLTGEWPGDDHADEATAGAVTESPTTDGPTIPATRLAGTVAAFTAPPVHVDRTERVTADAGDEQVAAPTVATTPTRPVASPALTFAGVATDGAPDIAADIATDTATDVETAGAVDAASGEATDAVESAAPASEPPAAPAPATFRTLLPDAPIAPTADGSTGPSDGWSAPALFALGVPDRLVQTAAALDPRDDAEWTAALMLALRPLFVPLPDEPLLFAGPSIDSMADALGISVVEPGQRSDQPLVAVSSEDPAEIAATADGRALHLVVGGIWHELVRLRPAIVSAAGPRFLLPALSVAHAWGVPLGYMGGVQTVRLDAVTVAMEIRATLGLDVERPTPSLPSTATPAKFSRP